jgi:hypothetical protein
LKRADGFDIFGFDGSPPICCEYGRDDMQMIPPSIDAAAVVRIVSLSAFLSSAVVVQAIIKNNNGLLEMKIHSRRSC